MDRMELFTEVLGTGSCFLTGAAAGDLLETGTQPEDSCLKTMVTTMVRGRVQRHEVLVRDLVGAWVNPSSPMVFV